MSQRIIPLRGKVAGHFQSLGFELEVPTIRDEAGELVELEQIEEAGTLERFGELYGLWLAGERAAARGALEVRLATCNQDGCEEPAAFRFTWPGEAEAGICAGHKPGADRIAATLGFRLRFDPIGASS